MIALVSIASEFRKVEDLLYPPLGLLYVGGALRKAGYEVKVYHIFAREIESTAREILSLRPEWVGFTVFTGLPCERAARLSRLLKAGNPSIPVVWGGVHPSLAPEDCLRESYVDCVVIGEGEATAVELAGALRSGKGPGGVKGVGYKKDGAPLVNERRPLIANLDDCAADWSLVAADRYLRPMGEGRTGIIYMSSRGCPHNCGFCYNRRFNLSRWRPHSVDFVIKDVQALKERHGISMITFSDDEVFVREERAFELLERLKGIGIECDWLEMRFDHVTRENLRRLVALNVRSIFLGWESGNDRILKMINKRLTRDYILEKCRVLSEFPQLRVDASGIIGFPTQTWEEVLENVDFAVELSRMLPSVNFNLGTYVPYPGTDLYDLALKEGFRPPDSTEGWGKYDILAGTFRLNWLPWGTEAKRRTLYSIDKYAKYLDRARYADNSDPFFKKLAKRVLYELALWRMKRHFFAFPFETRLEQWWNQRSITRRLYAARPSNPKLSGRP